MSITYAIHDHDHTIDDISNYRNTPSHQLDEYDIHSAIAIWLFGRSIHVLRPAKLINGSLTSTTIGAAHLNRRHAITADDLPALEHRHAMSW